MSGYIMATWDTPIYRVSTRLSTIIAEIDRTAGTEEMDYRRLIDELV
jgi:hypothetical protein